MIFLSILKALLLGFTGGVEKSKYLFIPKSLNTACFSTLKSFKSYTSVLKYLVLNDMDVFFIFCSGYLVLPFHVETHSFHFGETFLYYFFLCILSFLSSKKSY